MEEAEEEERGKQEWRTRERERGVGEEKKRISLGGEMKGKGMRKGGADEEEQKGNEPRLAKRVPRKRARRAGVCEMKSVKGGEREDGIGPSSSKSEGGCGTSARRMCCAVFTWRYF